MAYRQAHYRQGRPVQGHPMRVAPSQMGYGTVECPNEFAHGPHMWSRAGMYGDAYCPGRKVFVF